MDAKSQTLMERQLERLSMVHKDIRDSQNRIAEAVERLKPRPIEPSPTSTGDNPMLPSGLAHVGPGALDILESMIDSLQIVESDNRAILAHLQRII